MRAGHYLESAYQRLKSPWGWRLPQDPATLAPPGVASNRDQDPVPASLQTWGAVDYATYWMSDLINATTWQIASAALLVGLSTADAIVIASLAAILNALPTVLCGQPGTDHHIPFPISVRATFGYRFSLFCVLSRALLGSVWFGVNTYYGSFIVTEIIAAIWPNYRNIQNRLPASASITTQQMTSYIIYVIIQTPFLLIPVARLKRLFLVKAVLLVPVSIAMVIWICVKADNLQGVFNQPARVSGSARTWLWLATLSANANSWLSSTINMPDFTRYSKNKRAPWSMLPAIPIIRTIYAVMGVAMAGAGRDLYGEDIWNPIQVLPKWTGAGGRFLAFCCGCLWLLAQVSTNVSANSTPFGHDVMNMAPAWINIRRGSVICMIVGSWCMVPWLVVNSASKFLTFMNGYGCFICAIVSITLADYFLVRKRQLDVPSLYDPRGRYHYVAGTNWRAAAVQLIFMAIFIPGLAHEISPDLTIASGMTKLFAVNWFVNTFGPALVYYLLYLVLPADGSMVTGEDPWIVNGVCAESTSPMTLDGEAIRLSKA